MCKLSLGSQFLGDQNELYQNVKCSIYSSTQVIEAIWLRNNKQVPLGATNSINQGGGPVGEAQLSVLVLDGRQEFKLTDLMSQAEGANFKCLARNAIGYSDACELSQLDKQTLLGEYLVGRVPVIALHQWKFKLTPPHFAQYRRGRAAHANRPAAAAASVGYK